MRAYLLGLILIHTVSAVYILNKTQSLESANYTAVSMARRPKSILGQTVDVALGLNNGTVLLASTDNFHSQISYDSFVNSSIISLEWTQFGIFTVFASRIIMTETISLKSSLELSFAQNIVSAAVGYRASGTLGRIVTGVSFNNRIEVYEGTNLVMSKQTRSPCRALAVDHTGRYLYYFDNYTRYVVNILTRTEFDNTPAYTNHIAVVASGAANHEDITISLNSDGYLCVWDDYEQLSYYPGIYGQTQLKLSDTSTELLAYSGINSAINVWAVNYQNFTNWYRWQEIKADGWNTVAMDAKNDKLVFLSGNSLMIYVKESGGSAGLIVLIVFLGVFCCCALCIVVQQKYGWKNVFNVNAWRKREMQNDEISANYVGFNQNTKTVMTESSGNPSPTYAPPQQYSLNANAIQDPYVPPQLHAQQTYHPQPYQQPNPYGHNTDQNLQYKESQKISPFTNQPQLAKKY